MPSKRTAKAIIHVNQHEIKANRKDGGNRPVVTCKRRKETVYGHVVTIEGPSQVVYRPDKPLGCGAHCWIETLADVVVDGKRLPAGRS